MWEFVKIKNSVTSHTFYHLTNRIKYHTKLKLYFKTNEIFCQESKIQTEEDNAKSSEAALIEAQTKMADINGDVTTIHQRTTDVWSAYTETLVSSNGVLWNYHLINSKWDYFDRIF